MQTAFLTRLFRTMPGVAVLCVCLLTPGPAAANPLKVLHESALIAARTAAAQAKTPEARRTALGQEVAALNSLGRSEAALQRLDEGEADLPPDKRNAELRAKVLLPLDRCAEAIPQLQADVQAREAVDRKMMGAAHQPDGYLISGEETLLALTYCHAVHRRFDAATAALSRVVDPFDPSLLHYTAAWYAALRKLGANENARLEAASKRLPARGGVHAFSLAVAQSRMEVSQALRELQRQRLSDTEVQDAQAEVLFFAAVAADSLPARAEVLAQLDALAPFGSSEWVMARLLFPPR